MIKICKVTKGQEVAPGRQMISTMITTNFSSEKHTSYQESERNDKNCCKSCYSKGHRSNKKCVCVVPRSQRRVNLEKAGCRVCGCKGCSLEDREYNQTHEKSRHKVSDPREKHKSGHDKEKRHRRRHSRSYSRDRSESRDRRMNNFRKSPIWEILYNQLNSYPPLFGMGIPQRTKGYIKGEP